MRIVVQNPENATLALKTTETTGHVKLVPELPRLFLALRILVTEVGTTVRACQGKRRGHIWFLISFYPLRGRCARGVNRRNKE